MVQTAPLPAGFDPIDADTLPPAPAEADSVPAQISGSANQGSPLVLHPLEAWAVAERGTVEPLISRPLPGGGYLSTTRSALDALAAGEERQRQLAGSPILRASAVAAQQRQREDQVEAARRDGPDPRGVLAAAIAMRSEAQGEVDRLAPLVARARQLVETLDGQAHEQAAALEAHSAAAREALITALAAGENAPVAPPLDVAPAEALAGALATATAALTQLEREAAAAADRLARCRAGVARCALAVLTDIAAEEANAILEAADGLATRREDLNALSVLLTHESRRLNGTAPLLPPHISRALYPADRQLTGGLSPAATDWQARYDQLRRGEEQSEDFSLAFSEDADDLASDSVDAEAP